MHHCIFALFNFYLCIYFAFEIIATRLNKLIRHLLIAEGNNRLHNNRPQNGYEVHEDVNENTSFSWNGLTVGFGSIFGTRPSSTTAKIENKIAPKETKERIFKYSANNVNPYNKDAKIKIKSVREDNYPPIENKIAPKTGRVTFV